MPIFDSYYISDLFIPFLDAAVKNPGVNPWILTPPGNFPYGSVLFLLLYIPREIAYLFLGDMALGAGPLGLSLVKFPLLILEIILLLALIKRAPNRSRDCIVYFWLNPVPIFITYIHGQLDIASMVFCMLALFLLIEKRIVWSAVLMSCATLCKFHVVIIIPFLLVYLWNIDFKKQALQHIALWFCVWFFLSAFGFIPLVLSQKFLYASFSSPQALEVFGASLSLGHEKVIFIGFALFLFVLGRLCVSARITAQGLIFGCGILFGILTLITYPGPGWYFWPFPFLVLFCISYVHFHRALFWVFSFLYFFHFISFGYLHTHDMPLLSVISFTLVQTTLFAIIATLWVLVVRHEATIQRRMRPFIIGIAGDSGAGKNYASTVLSNIFGLKDSLIIAGDDYHKWERGDTKWQTYTHLSPKANRLEDMALDTKDLVFGKYVFYSHYDHTTGTFTEKREIKPARTIIFQGLHTFYLRHIREYFDLKIFLAPHEHVRMIWKIQRDVHERGYELEKVLENMTKRDHDSVTHIQPQKALADWVIEYLPTEEVSRSEVLAGRYPELAVRHTIRNDAHLDNLLKRLQQLEECCVEIDANVDDINRSVFIIHGSPSSQQIALVAADLFPNIRQITRAWEPPFWNDGLDGINQLIALALMQHR